MLDVLTVSVRESNSKDFPFIYNTWKKSYVCARNRYKRRQAEVFNIINKRVDRLRDSREVKFLIAADPEDKSFIIGWICVEGPLLHYIYVKNIYRRQGIALTMLNAAGLGAANKIYCTHWNKTATIIQENKPCFIDSELAQGVLDV